MTELNANDIVTWGGSSEPYQIITICMMGNGPAVFMQSRSSGYFIALQPDECSDLELISTPNADAS